MLAKRGNICGTHGSIEYWECFPDEDVCCGCVAPVRRWNILEDGRVRDLWAISSPDFKHGVRTGYCRQCREREGGKLRRTYEQEMRYLGLEPYEKGQR
jgi:hypothetical protein